MLTDLYADGELTVQDVDTLCIRSGQQVNDSNRAGNYFPDDYIDENDVKHLVYAIAKRGYGDTDFNGQVEQGDLDMVLQNWGSTDRTWSTGDFNANGQTEQGDLDIVMQNWGNTPDTPLTVNGTSGNDVLYGLNGDDTIIGGDGDDFIWGGAGRDVLNGGAGVDFYVDREFKDTIDDTEGLDNDFDGLTNWLEIDAERDPLSYLDSDGDGLSDDWEVAYGLDPFTVTSDDALEDFDGLGLSIEYRIGTSPVANDTDGDLHPDDQEYGAGSSGLLADSTPDSVSATGYAEPRLRVDSGGILYAHRQIWSIRVGEHVLTMLDFGDSATEYIKLPKGGSFLASLSQVAYDFDDDPPHIFSWNTELPLHADGFIEELGTPDVFGYEPDSLTDLSQTARAKVHVFDIRLVSNDPVTYLRRTNGDPLTKLTLKTSPNIAEADITAATLRPLENEARFYLDADRQQEIFLGTPVDLFAHGFQIGEDFDIYVDYIFENSLGDLDFRVEFTGEKWSGSHVVRAHAQGFDANLEASSWPWYVGFPESDEESQGMPILVDTDDDDGNGLSDLTQEGGFPVAEENDDLVRLDIGTIYDQPSYPPTDPDSFELKWNGAIELYTDPDGNTPVGGNSTSIDPWSDNVFWVRGMEAGDGEVTLEVHDPEGDTDVVDRILFNAIEIDGPLIVNPDEGAPYSANEVLPGAQWPSGNTSSSSHVTWGYMQSNAEVEYAVGDEELRFDVNHGRIEIVDADRQSTDELRLALFQNSYNEQTHQILDEFIDPDPRRFYVKVVLPDLAGKGDRLIAIETINPGPGIDGRDLDDAPSVVWARENLENPGVFYTPSQVLVGLSEEDEFTTPNVAEDNSIADSFDDAQDRTHLIGLGGKVKVSVNAEGQEGNLIFDEADVPIDKTLSNIKLTRFNVNGGQATTASTDFVKSTIADTNGLFAKIGVAIPAAVINGLQTVDAPNGVDVFEFDNSGASIQNGDMFKVSEAHGTLAGDDITIFYVGQLTTFDLELGLLVSEGFAAAEHLVEFLADNNLPHSNRFVNSIWYSANDPNPAGTFAHELMHILMNAGHDDSTSEYLFYPQSDGPIGFNHRTRLSVEHKNSILGSNLLDAG